MAFRLGDYVIRGELRNTRPNGVYGWLEFAPDYGVHIELTGNLKGQLKGKYVKFSTPRRQTPATVDPQELPPEIDSLADRQIGVVGEGLLRRVKVPTIELEKFAALSPSEQAKFCVEKDCLYLEWFSQNGRVVAEILDPHIEFIDENDNRSGDSPEFEPLGDTEYGVGITEVYLDNTGGVHSDRFEGAGDEDDEDDEEDPYGLFDKDLERSVAEALEGEGVVSEQPPGERSWDDVLPGIDPETKAMYEQWDEIFEGKKDEPVAYLFETPLKLPPPDKVTSDQEAEPLVKAILAQLALLSVAIDVCEHYTPMQTYRLLMSEILPTAKVHPNLAASQMVQHYSTSDYCEACEAEFDDEYDSPSDDEP